jgi:hypothetical protein
MSVQETPWKVPGKRETTSTPNPLHTPTPPGTVQPLEARPATRTISLGGNLPQRLSSLPVIFTSDTASPQISPDARPKPPLYTRPLSLS